MLPARNYNRRNHNDNTWLPSILDDFFGDEFLGVPVARQFATPAVNIKETEKTYEIEVAAPGMTRDDFKISINSDNELVINLEKKAKEEQKNDKNDKKDAKDNGTWLRREFSYATYSQSFVIPEDVDEENIGAKMENGVLTINLPKKAVVNEVPATRQIDIQ